MIMPFFLNPTDTLKHRHLNLFPGLRSSDNMAASGNYGKNSFCRYRHDNRNEVNRECLRQYRPKENEKYSAYIFVV